MKGMVERMIFQLRDNNPPVKINKTNMPEKAIPVKASHLLGLFWNRQNRSTNCPKNGIKIMG